MQLAKLEYRMNRKSLIICLSVLAALVVFCVSAITVLYSGDKGGDTTISQEELFAEASSRCPVPGYRKVVIRAIPERRKRKPAGCIEKCRSHCVNALQR